MQKLDIVAIYLMFLTALAVAAEDDAVAALRACLAGTDSVCYLAVGPHTVDYSIQVNRNVEIRGSGVSPSSTILKRATANHYNIITMNGSYARVYNLQIDGNRAAWYDGRYGGWGCPQSNEPVVDVESFGQ